jgi:ABC-type uncharacterized transport system substrate-binding protein
LIRRPLGLVLLAVLLFSACPSRRAGHDLYTIGIFQVTESTTLGEARKGVLQALENAGLRDGVNVRLKIRNAMGDISEVQRIAESFAAEKVDLIVALSTPCLHAALIATKKIPIVFASVANPYLVQAGRSAREHLPNVTGVASTGPIRETLDFIHRVLPRARRIGTLWTPAEVNSEYYLGLAREAAGRLGLEILATPVANAGDVLFAAQLLVNRKVDAIYQISDNTVNAVFETLGQVAAENGLPLFGGFMRATRLGACASMGWDFFDMGLKAGALVVRVKSGERPADIPFEAMSSIRLSINLAAARAQGVEFSPQVLASASEVLTTNSASDGD